jgi:uncharacterized protein YndB with AHSA1/START domain
MNWIDRRRQQRRRRRAMKVLAGGLGSLAALFLVGALLPAEHPFTSQAVLERPPETVWRVLTDLDGLPFWRSDLTAVERLPDLGGKPAWREVGRSGSRVVELTRSEPPRLLVMRRAGRGSSGLPMRTVELAALAHGTLVTVTDRVESRNPFRRVLVRLQLPQPAVLRLLRDLTERLSVTRREVVAQPGG